MDASLPSSLEAARIQGIPSAAFYIPEFITRDEEDAITAKITTAPRPKWKQLAHRRLQTWPSELVHDKLLHAPLPKWLEDPIVPRLLSLRVSEGSSQHIFAQSPHARPNHVLVNEYPSGVGIMPHKYGAAYWPVVCTVSLGSSLCLDLHGSKADGALDPIPAWRVLQEPRSLLIITDNLYADHFHGISDVNEDINLAIEGGVVNWSLLGNQEEYASGRNVRETRISLTYRDVLCVSMIGKTLGLFGKASK